MALKYLRESHPELAGKPSAVVMGNSMGNWLRDLILEAEEGVYPSFPPSFDGCVLISRQTDSD
jgi:hypothetical protein